MRLITPALSLGLVWWLAAAHAGASFWSVLVAYSLLTLAMTAAGHRMPGGRTGAWLGLAGGGADMVLALLVASGAVPSGGAAIPVAALLLLRVFEGWQRLSFLAAAPLVLVIGSVAAAWIVAVAPQSAQLGTVTSWWLLLSMLGLFGLALLANASQRREVVALRQSLRSERQTREARVGELERTANELRARMREQHALEEGLRVITSSLSLDEVLHQIVDSTIHTLGRERVSGMSISLMVDGDLTHHAVARDGDGRAWANPLAQRAMEQGVPLIISDATHHGEYASLGHRLRSAISVPLFVGEGEARGALTVVSAEAAALSSSDARHLAAFAAQAGIAIGNAELHSRIRTQQQLLESVIRDINDGLIVVEDERQIVMTNPAARQILQESDGLVPIRERLLELAASARAGDQPVVTAEFKIAAASEPTDIEPAEERFYQAVASPIQQEREGRLTAIVLHDITHQRAEERARTEFISMVSHELRNPLHSLNGFLKVVIQGRAGELNSLQQDFLQMADQQVDLLKGRIAELLEYNRMRAGRLTLKPQLNDLPLLIAGTTERLALQAEQNGLQLGVRSVPDLPECVFDSERISQVLTNLIENAIKATPSGGRITVSSEVHEGEVWVSVTDTGIGIAPGDLGKIFKRFFRANTHKSVYGNHLGLGLTICQQIVEGHGGRIWVESELNVGSTFTFSLPLVAQEAAALAQ